MSAERHIDYMQPETNERKLDYLLAEAGAHSLQRPGYAAGVESETCPDCDRGSVPAWDGEGNEIGEQPCQRCGGTGSIEKAKPQRNGEVRDPAK